MDTCTLMLLQWLEKDFLGYLDEWEASVSAREGFTRAEKASMILSKETLEGLRLTGMTLYNNALYISSTVHVCHVTDVNTQYMYLFFM